MKLHTLATPQNHEIVTYHKQYLKLVDYSNEDCQKLLDEAKYYYIKMCAESESTDFNDNYSDSWTNYYPITLQNILVANGKFVGAVAQGTGKYGRSYVICTLDIPKAHWYDGSDYSHVSKDFFLQKYDLPVSALDVAKDYHIEQTSLQYKKGDDSEQDKLLQTYHHTHLLMAFDVVVEDGVAIGVKQFEHTFLLDDQSTWEYKVVSDDRYIPTNYFVKTLTLTKTK